MAIEDTTERSIFFDSDEFADSIQITIGGSATTIKGIFDNEMTTIDVGDNAGDDDVDGDDVVVLCYHSYLQICAPSQTHHHMTVFTRSCSYVPHHAHSQLQTPTPNSCSYSCNAIMPNAAPTPR